METTDIAAPPARVWRALTVVDEVRRWDDVMPVEVPAGYPQPGQHARWSSRIGPFKLTLHDRIRGIDPERQMVAAIDIGFVHVDEEYRLRARADGGTTLVTDDQVRSRVPGLGWLARRLARADVRSSMRRLKEHCERQDGGGPTDG